MKPRSLPRKAGNLLGLKDKGLRHDIFIKHRAGLGFEGHKYLLHGAIGISVPFGGKPQDLETTTMKEEEDKQLYPSDPLLEVGCKGPLETSKKT